MQVSIGKILQALEGCACPMGVLCREFLKKLLLDDNEIAIVDMEAGVEHFGRGVVEAIDQIVVVVEPSFDSLKMAEKINSLASGMHKKLAVVVNKTVSEAVSLKMMRELSADGIKIIGYVPIDPLVSESCWEGHIPQMGAAFEAAGKVLDTLLQSDEGIRKSG
jgi:CO dehydrogenase maturation factor